MRPNDFAQSIAHRSVFGYTDHRLTYDSTGEIEIMITAINQHNDQPRPQPKLIKEEQRIADAVVIELTPILNRIRDKVEENGRLLEVLERQVRGINKILASENMIPDDPDL